MKIFGLGTDIVNIKRLEKIIKKDKNTFKSRIFSKKEILYCDKKKILFHIMQKDMLQKKL
tara:strand:+ start:276 stop:455 length:180 start_codon:yes stop_codon:yes gene_type:complete